MRQRWIAGWFVAGVCLLMMTVGMSAQTRGGGRAGGPPAGGMGKPSGPPPGGGTATPRPGHGAPPPATGTRPTRPAPPAGAPSDGNAKPRGIQ